MILAQVTSLSVVLAVLCLAEHSSAQFWKNDKVMKQWQQATGDNSDKSSSSNNMAASNYMNAFVPAAINSGLGSLIGSYQDTSKDSSASAKDDYAKSYVPASVASSAATYESAPSLKQPQPQPNYAPAYPSYDYKPSYPSYPSYPSSEYNKPSYGSHESYSKPSYGSHESYSKPSYGSHESYSKPSYGSHESYSKPSYGSHESYSKPSYGSHEYKQPSYQAVLPPSVLPQGAYPIHQPTITNTGETIIENLVGGIPFDCRGRSTGHWRDNKYCDIFHACVFGIQRKTYVCPYVGERTYFDESTRRCEFVYRNPHGCGSNSYYH